MREIPRLILVECGPGDPELITLKGISAIREAEVILYDAFIAEPILQYASPTCRLINVHDRHKFSDWESACECAAHYVFQDNRIVWLKRSDQQDSENSSNALAYFQRNGIRVEMIPGISSILAAPASIGIPVTRRGVNESFFVLNVQPDVLCEASRKDLRLVAQSSATVILQITDSHNFTEIIKIFRQLRGEFENAAIVQNATLPEQTFTQSTLATIEAFNDVHKTDTPVILIIGKVVNETTLHDLFGEKQAARAQSVL